MEQTYYISSGLMGFAAEEKSNMLVLRGHAKFSVKTEIARVKDTRFGRELLQQIKLCRGCLFGRYGSLRDPVDLVYQHCLSLLERLVPQASLQDLSLECFLHSHTYHLELAEARVNEVIRIEGEDKCLYTPPFAISPMRTADVLQSRKAVPHFRACRTWIAPTRDEGKYLSSVQGKVITVEGVLMFFKPRIEGGELEFERELRIMSLIEEAGLRARIRVPRLQGIVVSGENGETTMGMLMT